MTKTISVTEGIASELKALAEQYGTNVQGILNALVYMTRDPYNRNMLEHLIRINRVAKEFDNAFYSRKYEKAAEAAHKLNEIIHSYEDQH